MRGHPHGARHSWLYVPQPAGLPGTDGYGGGAWPGDRTACGDRAVSGHWIEYGVAERAYALQCPGDFNGPLADSAIEYKHQDVGAVMIESGLPVSAATSPTVISRTLFLMRQARKTAGSPRRHTGGLIPAQFALYALALP